MQNLKIVYLNIGSSFDQLRMSSRSARQWNPSAEIVVYSNSTEAELVSNKIEFDHHQYWKYIQEDARVAIGSKDFAELTAQKSAVIIDSLQTYNSPALYVDTDVIFNHSVSDSLAKCLEIKPLWISSDSHWGFNGVPSLGVCTGILAFKPDPSVLSFLQKWHLSHLNHIQSQNYIHDQDAFNLLYQSEQELYALTGVFPVTFAMPGWMYPSISHFHRFKNGVVTPPMFHCSYVAHDEEKIARMKHLLKMQMKHQSWAQFCKNLIDLVFSTYKECRPSYSSVFHSERRKSTATKSVK